MLVTADLHTHSAYSFDADYDPAQMLAAAAENGLRQICITDHVDFYTPTDVHLPDFAARRARLAQLRGQFPQLTVLEGAEVSMTADPACARSAMAALDGVKLDFVIGSVHLAGENFQHFDLYYIEKKDETYYHSVIDSYLEDVLRLAQWGKFSVLGHLTLPLRYINESHGEQMTFAGHEDQCREIFRTLIENGCGIECNTNRGHDPLPDGPLLRLYRELGGEIITLGSDAHDTRYVGCAIRERQELLRQCGFRYFTTFEGGRPAFRPL